MIRQKTRFWYIATLVGILFLPSQLNAWQETKKTKTDDEFKKLIVGSWKADKEKTTKYLKSIGEDKKIKSAVGFCERGIGLAFLSDNKMKLFQGNSSEGRGIKCEFEKVKIVDKRKVVRVKFMDSAAMIITVLDKNTIAVVPKITEDDPDPPLVFTRQKKESSKKKGSKDKSSGKDDKSKSKKDKSNNKNDKEDKRL